MMITMMLLGFFRSFFDCKLGSGMSCNFVLSSCQKNSTKMYICANKKDTVVEKRTPPSCLLFTFCI